MTYTRLSVAFASAALVLGAGGCRAPGASSDPAVAGSAGSGPTYVGGVPVQSAPGPDGGLKVMTLSEYWSRQSPGGVEDGSQ